jgi:hypothetical protein
MGSILGLALCLAWCAQDATCAECKGDARRTALCATHLESETTTLREVRAVYARSKDPEERVRALERAAGLTRAHSNAPSPIVARFLADGLDDELLAVRRTALELLLAGQHREETTRAVIDGWREAQRLWRVLDAKLVLSEAPAEAGKPPVVLTTDELSAVPEYVLALLGALGEIKDERSCSALVTFSRSELDRTPGRFLVAATDALLALDSRRSWDAAIALLGHLEDAFVDGQVPPRFADARGDLLASYKKPLDNATSHDHAEIVALLLRHAERRKLARPESPEPLRAGDWKVWFKAARETLPDKLGA